MIGGLEVSEYSERKKLDGDADQEDKSAYPYPLFLSLSPYREGDAR